MQLIQSQCSLPYTLGRNALPTTILGRCSSLHCTVLRRSSRLFGGGAPPRRGRERCEHPRWSRGCLSGWRRPAGSRPGSAGSACAAAWSGTAPPCPPPALMVQVYNRKWMWKKIFLFQTWRGSALPCPPLHKRTHGFMLHVYYRKKMWTIGKGIRLMANDQKKLDTGLNPPCPVDSSMSDCVQHRASAISLSSEGWYLGSFQRFGSFTQQHRTPHIHIQDIRVLKHHQHCYKEGCLCYPWTLTPKIHNPDCSVWGFCSGTRLGWGHHDIEHAEVLLEAVAHEDGASID